MKKNKNQRVNSQPFYHIFLIRLHRNVAEVAWATWNCCSLLKSFLSFSLSLCLTARATHWERTRCDLFNHGELCIHADTSWHRSLRHAKWRAYTHSAENDKDAHFSGYILNDFESLAYLCVYVCASFNHKLKHFNRENKAFPKFDCLNAEP